MCFPWFSRKPKNSKKDANNSWGKIRICECVQKILTRIVEFARDFLFLILMSLLFQEMPEIYFLVVWLNPIL